MVYLINRLPTPVLSLASPFQSLFGTPRNYAKLRVFGFLCFPWLRPYTKHKLEDRSASCVFIGYSLTQSAYLCLEPKTGRSYTSRHVFFEEMSFPFRHRQAASLTDSLTKAAPTTTHRYNSFDDITGTLKCYSSPVTAVRGGFTAVDTNRAKHSPLSSAFEPDTTYKPITNASTLTHTT